MPNITNVQVAGLEQSIYRSGYPMLHQPPTQAEFDDAIKNITQALLDKDYKNPHIKRAIGLANMKGGGHDQFLTGITVSYDMTFSNKAWVDSNRYIFLNFVSSMSTMHRIAALDGDALCNKYVEGDNLRRMRELQDAYKKASSPEEKQEAYLTLLYNAPPGLELTAGMVTNYRCLQNIYEQRRNHRLPDFQLLCDWIETLPLAQELIVKPAKRKKAGITKGVVRKRVSAFLGNIGIAPDAISDISDDDLLKFFTEALED